MSQNVKDFFVTNVLLGDRSSPAYVILENMA